MKQKLRHTLFLMSALPLFSVSALNANSCDIGPCDYSWLDGIRVEAEFLYWKPCFEGLDYAYRVEDASGGSVPTDSELHYVHHNWKPGFRIGVGFDDIFCGWALNVNYARIEGSDSSSVDAVDPNGAVYSSLWLANDNVTYASAEASHSFTYQQYNILFSRHCCLTDCHNFTPFIGVAGLILSQRIKAEYLDTSTAPNTNYILKWDGDYVGTGLKLGSSYGYKFTDCLTFNFSGSMALLYGTSTPKAVYSAVDDDEVVSYDRTVKGKNFCLFTPGFNVRAGFGYDTSWCGHQLSLLFSYDFEYFGNVVTPARFVDDLDINRGVSTSSKFGSLGFHGIRVGASYAF